MHSQNEHHLSKTNKILRIKRVPNNRYPIQSICSSYWFLERYTNETLRQDTLFNEEHGEDFIEQALPKSIDEKYIFLILNID